MKKSITFLSLIALILFVIAGYHHNSKAGMILVGSKPPAAAAGPAIDYSEDWNCTNSDDPDCDLNWTEVCTSSDWDIVGNEINAMNASTDEILELSTGTLDTDNGFAKITIADLASGDYFGFAIRYTNSTSPFYLIQVDKNQDDFGWFSMDTCSTSDFIQEESNFPTMIDGDTLCVTWTGTGVSTTIRAWVNCTGNTPTSASNWGGDTTPDAALIDCGSYCVDTNKGIGIYAWHTTDFDDFFAGDL